MKPSRKNKIDLNRISGNNFIKSGSSAIAVASALTLLLQGGFADGALAKTDSKAADKKEDAASNKTKIEKPTSKDKAPKEESKKPLVKKEEKNERKQEPPEKSSKTKESEKSEKTDKKDIVDSDEGSSETKKKGWFSRKGEEKSTEKSGEKTTEKSTEKSAEKQGKSSPQEGKSTKDSAAAGQNKTDQQKSNTTETVEAVAPRFTPDTALVSVLNDVVKELGRTEDELDEEFGIDSENEKVIIDLARQVLERSLKQDGLEIDRILLPEQSKSAKSAMVTEVWGSGEVKVSDALCGSVAAVWAKRVDGLLNVTIAGECKGKSLPNGRSIGEFIVVVNGRSPIESGFDIQSRKDVEYWLAKLSSIEVDAACCKRPKKQKAGDNSSESDEQLSENDEESPVAEESSATAQKKKRNRALETVITERVRQYLLAMEDFERARQLELETALALAESGAEESPDIADDQSKSSKKKDHKGENPANKTIDPLEESLELAEFFGTDKDAKAESKTEKQDKHVIAKNDSNAKKEIDSIDKKEKTAQSDKKKAESAPDDKNGALEVSERQTKEDLSEKSKREEKKEKIATAAPKKKELRPLDEPEKKAEKPQKKTDEKKDKKKVEKTAPLESVAQVKKAPPVERDDWRRSESAQVADQPVKTAKTIETVKTKPPTELFTPTGESTHLSNQTNQSSQSGQSLQRIASTSLSPAPAGASSRKWESPASGTTIKQPSLDATVQIPDRAMAGQFLTVAVHRKDGTPESGVELSFNGATLATNPNGQAIFMVPDDAPPGRSLHVSLASRPELSPGVVDILQPLSVAHDAQAPQIDKVTKIVGTDGILRIDGHDFIGMANQNRIIIDSMHEATVISASPVQLRVKLPETLAPGKHSVNVSTHGLRSNPSPFELVKVTIEQELTKKKELSHLLVRVLGTNEPVHVRITNKTPDLLKLVKGNNILVTTSGGANNSYTLAAKQTQKGEYKIDTRVEM